MGSSSEASEFHDALAPIYNMTYKSYDLWTFPFSDDLVSLQKCGEGGGPKKQLKVQL